MHRFTYNYIYKYIHRERSAKLVTILFIKEFTPSKERERLSELKTVPHNKDSFPPYGNITAHTTKVVYKIKKN